MSAAAADSPTIQAATVPQGVSQNKAGKHALVVEHDPTMAPLLHRYGWTCEALHPLVVLTTVYEGMGPKIRAGTYDLVWIRMAGHRVLPRRKIQAFVSLTKHWMQTAQVNGVPAFQFGIADKVLAEFEPEFLKDKHVTTHRLC